MINSKVKTKDGFEEITAYDVNEINLPVLIFKGLQRNHKIVKYATDYFCLDTETSKIDDITGWIYQWAICIKQKIFVYGRRPSELIDFLCKCAEHYELNNEKRIIIYIHNMQYDFAYLKKYLSQYDPQIKALAIDNHCVLTVDVLGFRFICSYKLTNLSLAVLSDKYAKRYIKAVGEIDYNVLRYQDSELTDDDWFYMFSDVASQYDGVKEYLSMNGYTFAADAPFTSTGFVRVECRKSAKKCDKWHEEFQKSALSLSDYRLCRQAFMGGITICSWRYSGKTIREKAITIKTESGKETSVIKLGHKDFTSRYPATQMLDYMPTGKPMRYGHISDKNELNALLNKYCCVFMLTLENVRLKKGVTAPYIPSSKCLGVATTTNSKGVKAPDWLKINGKIVYCKKMTIAVTELDFYWIKRQYTASAVYVSDMICFKRGKMPDWLKSKVMEYFKNKCTLKHEEPILYTKSKNLLNGIYGMTATAIIRPSYEINQDSIIGKVIAADKDADDESKLKKYYSSHNSFMSYQWSVYTTAHSRNYLMQMIEATGDGDGHIDKKNPENDDLTEIYKNFLYCDTDSVFYIITPENEIRMKKFTEECIDRAINGNAYIGDNYLGAPTNEPHIRAFRGLHSKCYAMEELNEKTGKHQLNVVIAGIPKKAIKWQKGKPVKRSNAWELGNVDNLEDGFTFAHCGGTRCVYNDIRPIEIRDINGHKTELATSAVIENIEKVLSNTMLVFDKDKKPLDISLNW